MSSTKQVETLKPVQDYIIAGLTKMISIELGVDTHLSTEATFHDAFRKIPSEKRTNRFSFLKLASVEFGETSSGGTLSNIRPTVLNNNSLKPLLGARQRYANSFEDLELASNDKNIGGLKKVTTHALYASFVPCVMTFDLAFMTKSFSDQLNFISTWAFAQVKNRLNFELEYTNTQLPIMVQLSTSLSSPEKNKLGEDAGYYILEGTITISGVLSTNDKRDVNVAPVIHYEQIEVE